MELVYFKEGVFEYRVVKDVTSTTPSGVMVQWQPSEEFFTDPAIDVKRTKELFYTLSCLCPGLKIKFSIYRGDCAIVSEETYFAEHGLSDLVNNKVKDTEIIKNRMVINHSDGKNAIDLVLTFTSNYSLNIISYVNTGETDAGPHITGIKTLLTREFNKFFKEKKWLKEKDENLSGNDLQEGMFIAFNITAKGVSYDAQIKSRIVKLDMSPFNKIITENLHTWFERNEKDIKVIFDKAASARKAREAAKKARDKAREGTKKKQKALKFDSKLADCNAKDRSKCEIYITEGDSASGNLKMARDNATQAVMPVRGKILNTQKATLAQVNKNAEIMTMLDAFFGPGEWTMDSKTLKVTYNKIRYGKIIIMSDADVDGAHIKNLFYTFIWNLCPDLITNGYVYAGVPPLYKITLGGNKGYKYLKNDEDLARFREENMGKKYQVGRMKGLGEMDVDETEETLTHPESRIIKQIHVEDVFATDKLFNDLMGTKVEPRKEYIRKHSEEATYNAE